MAIWKRRPTLAVIVPRQLPAGQKFEAEFVLDLRRPLEIEHFDVKLLGRTRAAVNYRDWTEVGSRIGQTARLSGPRELAAGRLRFPVRFSIPGDAPPSFVGRVVRVSYTLAAELAIPWWPDLDREFELSVVPNPRSVPAEARPLLYSSAPEGPREREPHVEVSINSTQLRPGEILSGAVALSNVASARYTGIRVRLAGYESSFAPRGHGEIGSWQIDLPMSRVREGEPITFDFRIPDVPPTYSNEAFRISWGLEATVTRRLGADVVMSMPIDILPGAAASARSKRAPPTVGNPRVRLLWGEVAERAGMTFEDDRLTAKVGAADVTVWRENSAGQPVLAAAVRYPSLGLELTSQPVGGLSRLWRDDGVPLGESSRVSGRDEAQVRAAVGFLEHWVQSLEVRRISDEELLLQRAAAGLTAEPLLGLAEAALAIARRIPDLARSLPAPAGVDLSVWRAIAERVNGQLLLARPSVIGEVDGRRVEVSQLWGPGAVAVAVKVCVHTLTPIPERAIKAMPKEALTLTKAWAAKNLQLSVEPDQVSLCMLDLPVDARDVLGAMDQLIELTEALCRRGAYR